VTGAHPASGRLSSSASARMPFLNVSLEGRFTSSTVTMVITDSKRKTINAT
jgi:hypothetical protein